MWYGVSLLLCGETPSRTTRDLLWEESIVLVQAVSEDEANLQGERIGREMEIEYDSASGEHIHWTFHRVCKIHEIQEQDIFQTGTEVFSRFLRNSEAQSLMTPFNEEEAPEPSSSSEKNMDESDSESTR